jgi:hypothetical protein
LIFLNLDGTRVADAGLAQLRTLTQLKLVSLRKTAVTAAGIDELQRLLPDCSIIGPD